MHIRTALLQALTTSLSSEARKLSAQTFSCSTTTGLPVAQKLCKENGKNSHLKINKNGKIIVSIPSTDSDDAKYISSLLPQPDAVPIVQVLGDINKVVNFTRCFNYFSIKHKK